MAPIIVPVLELEDFEPPVAKRPSAQSRTVGSRQYAWIGLGAGGGRIVKSFYDLGYKKVLALGASEEDLSLPGIPQDRKFVIDPVSPTGASGTRPQQIFQRHHHRIFHLCGRKLGSFVDHIMICISAEDIAASGVEGLVKLAGRYNRFIRLKAPDKRVGIVMTLPKRLSGRSKTAVAEVFKMASEGRISPLIVMDAGKLDRMFSPATVKAYWPNINNTFAGFFDVFNKLSNRSSRYSSFDAADYAGIMQAGGCLVMSAVGVKNLRDPFAISEAIGSSLERTVMTDGYDLSTARAAGCIVVGGKKIMARVKGLQQNIDYAFDVLADITGSATIHRGIHEDNTETLRVYTIIAGLSAPAVRL
ncbi:MAG: hypothetical protein KAR47_15815 [Planctomycetes bacterium]|nr:hypothetical protein [Planctomycetota bacterium]